MIEGCTALALWRGVCSEHTNTSAVQGAPHAAASLEINVVRDDDAEEDVIDERPVIASPYP